MLSSEQILTGIKSDNRSGASTLYNHILTYTRCYLDELSDAKEDKQEALLKSLPARVQSAKLEMAPFVNLASQLRKRIGDVNINPKILQSLITFVTDLEKKHEDSTRNIALNTEPFIPNDARIVTISMSSTVLAVFQHHPAPETLTVIVPESRPECEGVDFTVKLDKIGVHTEIIADFAVEKYASECDIFLCGADAVTENYLVNKIGTGLIALLVNSAGGKCISVFDESKIVSSADFAFNPHEYSPDELTTVSLRNGRISNYYFESVDLTRFTHFITETGPKSLSEIKQMVEHISC